MCCEQNSQFPDGIAQPNLYLNPLDVAQYNVQQCEHRLIRRSNSAKRLGTTTLKRGRAFFLPYTHIDTQRRAYISWVCACSGNKWKWFWLSFGRVRALRRDLNVLCHGLSFCHLKSSSSSASSLASAHGATASSVWLVFKIEKPTSVHSHCASSLSSTRSLVARKQSADLWHSHYPTQSILFRSDKINFQFLTNKRRTSECNATQRTNRYWFGSENRKQNTRVH